MRLEFYKYHGAGNDFIVIDNRGGHFDKTNVNLVRHLCQRHFGIGSDGLILMENHPELDFDMTFFNPDGTQSFCGNGSRCAIAFAYYLLMIEKDVMFNSTDGVHHGKYVSEDEIWVNLHNVNAIETGESYTLLNTGSPHYICEVDKVDAVDVLQEGRKIRYSNRFKNEGVNVNFIETITENHIKIRTYERGVENETLACGTGITAAAISYAYQTNSDSPVVVEAKGGKLTVTFEREGEGFKNIWLKGPAKQVFKGEIYV